MYRNLKECFFFGFSFLFSSNIIYCNDGENLECRQCLKWILSAHCNWIKPILTVTKRQSYCCYCRVFFRAPFDLALCLCLLRSACMEYFFNCIFLLFDGSLSVYWLQHLKSMFCGVFLPDFTINNAINFRFVFSFSLFRLSLASILCVCVWIYLFGSLLRWPLWLWENSKPTQRDAHHMFTLNKRAEKFWKHRHSTIWMQTTRLFHHSDQHFRNIWKCNRGKKSYLKTAI